ncbi:MAG: cytochrome C oxidase subunit II [Thermoanaerobaculia bacterium]|nr:cytochrome C oxidase subunit II [Thermoanaerobaculia bacterium]
MKIVVYEKAFLSVGGVLLAVCLAALFYASFGMGIHLPGAAGRIDPALLATTPPFDLPGVREVGPGRYEVVMIGQAWKWVPNEIRIPAGSEVTFVATTPDVIHGMHVEGTRVNMMLIPGQIARNSYVFKDKGEHLLLCHEFCGINHHTMYGKVIVE